MLVRFITTQAAAMLVLLASMSAAPAAECPRKDALGTSRVLAVDPAIYPRVDSKRYPQTLPLEDNEVVLTFENGPCEATDTRVLTAAAHECEGATIFGVG